MKVAISLTDDNIQLNKAIEIINLYCALSEMGYEVWLLDFGEKRTEYYRYVKNIWKYYFNKGWISLKRRMKIGENQGRVLKDIKDIVPVVKMENKDCYMFLDREYAAFFVFGNGGSQVDQWNTARWLDFVSPKKIIRCGVNENSKVYERQYSCILYSYIQTRKLSNRKICIYGEYIENKDILKDLCALNEVNANNSIVLFFEKKGMLYYYYKQKFKGNVIDVSKTNRKKNVVKYIYTSLLNCGCIYTDNLEVKMLAKSLGIKCEYVGRRFPDVCGKGEVLECINTTILDGKKQSINTQYSICTGCGACEGSCPKEAISIIKNDGFFKANIDEKKCVKCGKCINVCPLYSKESGIDIDICDLYSYKDYEKNTVKESSSGGASYRILMNSLKQKKSVVGCIDCNNEAKHELITDEKDLWKTQKSKYMQSEFAPVIKKIQKNTNSIVVVGTPCQIAGLKNVMRNRENIIYIDLICHGVPHSGLMDSYKKFLCENQKFDLSTMKIIFRDKEKFSWMEEGIQIRDKEKRVCLSSQEDRYMKAFETGLCYNKSCYSCRWRQKSEADLRLGDYWGATYKNDKEGVSMIVCLSKKGEQILSELSENGELIKHEIKDYFTVQQVENNLEPHNYEEIICDLNKGIELDKYLDKYVKKVQFNNLVIRCIAALRRVL